MDSTDFEQGDNIGLDKKAATMSGLPSASGEPGEREGRPEGAGERAGKTLAADAGQTVEEGQRPGADAQAADHSKESLTSGLASAESEGDLASLTPSLGSPEEEDDGDDLAEAECPLAESAESDQVSAPSLGSTSETEQDPLQGAGPRPEVYRGDPSNTFYYVKWINWKGEKTPVITQSENGPCPLIAIMNILFLRWKVKIPPKTEVISVEQLMILLGDCILSTKPKESSEGLQLNFDQNMNDAMAVLPKLSTGLDVNVRFTGVGDFEYTPECIVFDLLDVPLYHGWLVDPQSHEVMQAVGRCSYNQLVEKIISSKHSTDSALVSEGLVAEQFLDATATQLTYHGLCELTAAAKEGELCVFFRNNHFSTMIKHKGHLYLLVTDQGFLSEQKLVWESLHNVEGDGNFCDAEFCLSHPTGRQLPYTVAQPPQQQIDQDYMVALSLQQQQQSSGDISDLELARQLQEEEDRRAVRYLQEQEHETQPQAAPARQPPAAGRQAGSERRQHREEKSKDCIIL
ncbi:ubiquitin carboxyl-terminal hydrolase MINDY-1 [Pristis pectinata]|uniref:ubiquitin carboxyl-terminal hydrolase MINDY-1 n=1 Tax=Pristis pectinata TaxID=685728 RepID=UPI00223DCB73|nr:ubiquitin carboxyl-terminal hydrolase MINDY-1 [Pristis pectinata]